MGFRNFAGGSTDYGGHVTRVGGSWWWPALFGVISIIAGILALVWPGPTLVVLAILFGIELIVWGIYRLASPMEHRGMPGRGLSVLSGVFGIIAGLILLVWPAISVLTLAVLAGIWLIVFGFVQLGMANQLRHAHTR